MTQSQLVQNRPIKTVTLPTLWVSDVDAILRLPSKSFRFRTYKETATETDFSGEHYIVANRDDVESHVKAVAWKIITQGGDCKIYNGRIWIEDLRDDGTSTPGEIVAAILRFAHNFDDWAEMQNPQRLTVKEASDIAKLAIRHLSKSEYPVELAQLRQRCGESSWDWGKMVKNWEKEFAQELRRRKKENATDDQVGDDHEQFSRSLAETGDTLPGKQSNRKVLDFLYSQWGERLRYNEMSLEPELDGQPVDTDVLSMSLAEDFDIDISPTKAIEAVLLLARKHSYHPVREYLKRVAEQYPEDYPELFGTIATRYFRSTEALNNAFMQKTLIGAVRRVFEPGCKHDTVTVLQGEQGLQKSAFWEKLIPHKDWFDDTISSSGGSDKDERMKLRRFWVLELAELEATFKKKEVASLRGFLTTKTDNLRPPYGRRIQPLHRTSIFVGTVNPEDFLVDPEGHRRYWVIPIPKDHRIPVEMLEAERDRLWAAAVHAYQRGEQNWLTLEEEKRNALSNKGFESDDCWEEPILAYLSERWDATEGRRIPAATTVTLSQILSEALRIDIARQDKGLQMRAGVVLKKLGWTKGKQRIDGKPKAIWFLVPSEVRTEMRTPENVDVTGVSENLFPPTQEVRTEVRTTENVGLARVSENLFSPLEENQENYLSLKVENSLSANCNSLEIGGNGGNTKPDVTLETRTVQTVEGVPTSVLTCSPLKEGDRVTFPNADVYDAPNSLTGTVKTIISPLTCRVEWEKVDGEFTRTENLADLARHQDHE